MKTKEPLISIVMPTFKTDLQTIERALNSIKKQSYENWELIIVDDNACKSVYKENLIQYSKKNNSKKISFIFHDDNKGANAARNSGILNASGEYIAFLDSDDEWDFDFLECVYSELSKNHPDIVSCRYRIKSKDGVFDSPIYLEENGNKYSTLIYYDCVGPTSAVVVKRQSILDAGMFDVELPARQDYDMWIRISKIGGIVNYIRDVKLTIYRMGEESISTRGLNTINGTEIVLKKILDDKTVSSFAKDIKYCHYLECGRNAASLYRFKLAESYFSKAFNNKRTFKVFAFFVLSKQPELYKFLRQLYRRYRTYLS